ncbi:MAG: hypothetical protein QMD14_06045 [Candidatus Aenigmarchaeota archaeon]|nr:hypothetical protein [Candidatus Aenigmarchaeota archaeon]
MEKGISAVVATVLMLIITIALASTAYMFVFGGFTTRISTAFSIVGAYEDMVTIRNEGTSAITSLTSVTVDGEHVAYLLIPKDPSLIGYWMLDEGSGTTAADSSGNGNTGTLYSGTVVCSGGNCPNWVDGKFGKALSFDGVDDYVEVPSSTSLQITDDITVAAWIKMDSDGATDQRVVLQKSGSYRLMIRHDPYRHIEVWLWLPEDDGMATLVGGNPISYDWFHHVVFTREKSTGIVKTYVDSIEQASISGKTSSIPVNTNPISIGKDWNEFDGIIDEVRIYNRALSAEEIKALYNMGGMIKPGQTGTIKLYPSSPLSKGLHTIKICTPSMCNTGYLTVV